MDPRIAPLTEILRPNTRLPQLSGRRHRRAGRDAAIGIDDVKRFPPLVEIQHAWTLASHGLRDRLDQLTAAELDASVACPFPLPIANPTTLGLLTFFVQHDSYHIGQLALLRKHAGLPAMQYA